MKTISGFIATSGYTEKYGGFRLSASALENIARGFLAADRPMLIDHDRSRAVRTTVLRAELRNVPITDDIGVWVEYEISDEDVERLEGRTGFSIGIDIPIESPPRIEGIPQFSLSADMAFFDAEDIKVAAKSLRSFGTVSIGHHMQLTSVVDLAKIIIDVGEYLLPLIASGALPKVVESLLSKKEGDPSQPATIEIKSTIVGPSGKRSFEAVIETNDVAVVNRALDSLDQHILEQSSLAVFDADTNSWREVSSDLPDD